MIEWVNRGNYQGREPETEFFVRKLSRIGKEKLGFFAGLSSYQSRLNAPPAGVKVHEFWLQ